MPMSVSLTRIRIQELTKKINFYNQQYHTHDKSVITDSEYDILYAELKELEKQHPKLLTDNSPTIRVGSKLLGGFKKIKGNFVGYYIHAGNKIAAIVSLSNNFKESSEVAKNYLEEVRNSIESDIMLVNLDINNKASLFYENPKRFLNLLTTQ